ncbi:MAG TPA: UDP-N-acetylmuramate dehydrogenase [Anaerolineae bacterium]|nr:UDP-N-acetylmuramate dehydrogenase [Anaerolineae bacterium]
MANLAPAFLQEALKEGLDDPVLLKEPMAHHTSFRIGGPADLFVRAGTIERLCQWVRLARQHGVPTFILGHGTNILVSDRGIRGLVIQNDCQAYELREEATNPEAILHAEGGASLPGLAFLMAEMGWAGLEWAIGIPGSVGSAVVNNAGAHGGCVADVLRRVTILTEEGEIAELPAHQLALGYRTSRFKGQGGREVVLAAEFALHREPVEDLAARMAEYTEFRRRTQPAEPSVGSIFKNPPGDFAGRLIEQAGLKGRRIGGAEISPVHANFIVNRGGARAADVLALIELARRTVRERFGVELELEIELVGEWG